MGPFFVSHGFSYILLSIDYGCFLGLGVKVYVFGLGLGLELRGLRDRVRVKG